MRVCYYLLFRTYINNIKVKIYNYLYIYPFVVHYFEIQSNFKFMKFFLILTVWFALSFTAVAQPPEVLPPDYVRTVQLRGNVEFSGIPIIKLGQSFTLDFDDLIGDEADYYYKISYYNYDWTPAELSRNEYLKGFDNMRIKSYKNSFNTLQIYTHYHLSLPNDDTEAFKVSGNYMLEVYDNNDNIVFSRPFIIYEDIVSVGTEIKRSRDLQYLNTHQIVNFSISNDQHSFIKNPDKNLNILIFQNQNFKKTITGIKPQYRTGTDLIYKYDQETAFDGGNEYLFFDSKDVRTTANNIEKTVLDDIYNLYVYANAPRSQDTYTYNPDINGNYKIQTLHGEDEQIESEYIWVHFALQDERPLPEGSEIHLFGGFNDYVVDDSTRLTYNPDTEMYEGKYLFKQGFYNYKYVLKDKDGPIDEGYFSGNYDKTENDYTVLAYYREPGGRYDRIIGRGIANSENMTN